MVEGAAEAMELWEVSARTERKYCMEKVEEVEGVEGMEKEITMEGVTEVRLAL